MLRSAQKVHFQFHFFKWDGHPLSFEKYYVAHLNHSHLYLFTISINNYKDISWCIHFFVLNVAASTSKKSAAERNHWSDSYHYLGDQHHDNNAKDMTLFLLEAWTLVEHFPAQSMQTNWCDWALAMKTFTPAGVNCIRGRVKLVLSASNERCVLHI